MSIILAIIVTNFKDPMLSGIMLLTEKSLHNKIKEHQPIIFITVDRLETDVSVNNIFKVPHFFIASNFLDFLDLFIHSFNDLYNTSSRKLLRGGDAEPVFTRQRSTYYSTMAIVFQATQWLRNYATYRRGRIALIGHCITAQIYNRPISNSY